MGFFLELHGLGFFRVRIRSGSCKWNPDPSPDPEFTLFTNLESGKIRLPYSFITLLRQNFQILIRILILFEIEN